MPHIHTNDAYTYDTYTYDMVSGGRARPPTPIHLYTHTRITIIDTIIHHILTNYTNNAYIFYTYTLIDTIIDIIIHHILHIHTNNAYTH
jgi:hypothetical protein